MQPFFQLQQSWLFCINVFLTLKLTAISIKSVQRLSKSASKEASGVQTVALKCKAMKKLYGDRAGT